MLEKRVNLRHPPTHKAPQKTSEFWSDLNLQYTVASLYLFYFKTSRCNNSLTRASSLLLLKMYKQIHLGEMNSCSLKSCCETPEFPKCSPLESKYA